MPDMTPVESSNLSAFRWEPYATEPPFDEGDLYVTFKNGRTYRYVNVPGEYVDAIHSCIESGESVGSYFSANIRHHFETIEVTQ